MSQSGTDVTAKGAGWNGRIAPGATAGPGFRASFSGGGTAPGSFTLNGVPCA
ncbi:cellulose-binding domain-containing protein [Streptacidiphilus sp. ASG 303]|nr:cellulose-binding domain-containing protein [Streptacidiphilus sp. ASG 303]